MQQRATDASVLLCVEIYKLQASVFPRQHRDPPEPRRVRRGPQCPHRFTDRKQLLIYDSIFR